jgi:hypothetical protein
MAVGLRLPHWRPIPLSLTPPVRIQRAGLKDLSQFFFGVILDGAVVALSHRRERTLVGSAAIPAVAPVTIHGQRGRSRRGRARWEVDLDAAARGAEI